MTADKPAGYPQAPCLHALVERFSSWSAITPEAWAEYDAAIERWQFARRLYTARNVIEPGQTKMERRK